MIKIDYELLDCGDSRKLERFGKFIVERSAPQAVWIKKNTPELWEKSDLYFDDKWNNRKEVDVADWDLQIQCDTENVNLRLFLSEHGQVGVFPEQVQNWDWIFQNIKKTLIRDSQVKVLNGFAYT